MNFVLLLNEKPRPNPFASFRDVATTASFSIIKCSNWCMSYLHNLLCILLVPLWLWQHRGPAFLVLPRPRHSPSPAREKEPALWCGSTCKVWINFAKGWAHGCRGEWRIVFCPCSAWLAIMSLDNVCFMIMRTPVKFQRLFPGLRNGRWHLLLKHVFFFSVFSFSVAWVEELNKTSRRLETTWPCHALSSINSEPSLRKDEFKIIKSSVFIVAVVAPRFSLRPCLLLSA